MLRNVRSTAQITRSAALPRFVVSPAASAFHTSANRVQAAAESQTVLTPSLGNQQRLITVMEQIRNMCIENKCVTNNVSCLNRIAGIRGDGS